MDAGRLGPPEEEARPLLLRRAAFEEVPALLRLIARAVERGSRRSYSAEQRRAICLSYVTHLYLEVGGAFETVVAARAGDPVGLAQLDPAAGRLRALFVDGPEQGHGLGRALLDHVCALARHRGCRRLHGAMSVDAASFYARAGFRRCPGPDHLLLGGIAVPVVPMARYL